MVSEGIRKRSGDPFFARDAVAVSGSSAGGFTFSPPCDAIFVGSSSDSGLICTFLNGGAAVTITGLTPGVYPFSLASISSAGGASEMSIFGLYTGSTSAPNI